MYAAGDGKLGQIVFGRSSAHNKPELHDSGGGQATSASIH